SGSVAEFGDRPVAVLLITDDGYVLSATEHLKPAGNAKSFTLKLGKTAGPPRPQLVFAIASSKPLEALNVPPDASRAAQVFPRVIAEASQRNLPLSVRAKYFVLQKMPETVPR